VPGFARAQANNQREEFSEATPDLIRGSEASRGEQSFPLESKKPAFRRALVLIPRREIRGGVLDSLSGCIPGGRILYLYCKEGILMGLLKRTYALPPETLDGFEASVPSGKRSSLIASLIAEWLERQRREGLRKEILVGCAEMSATYLESEEAYHGLEEEVEHGGEPRSKARRGRARSSRSR